MGWPTPLTGKNIGHRRQNGRKITVCNSTVYQTQGGTGRCSGSTPRAPEGTVRQQPGHRCPQEQGQFSYHPAHAEVSARDKQPDQGGGLPDPEGQHHVCGHPHHGQPGILSGKKQAGSPGLLHGGCGLHGAEGGAGQYLLRRGTHGRENAPPASLLHPHHEGWTAVSQGDFGESGAALPVAGRVPRPHEQGVPSPAAGGKFSGHQEKAHSHMAVQTVH